MVVHLAYDEQPCARSLPNVGCKRLQEDSVHSTSGLEEQHIASSLYGNESAASPGEESLAESPVPGSSPCPVRAGETSVSQVGTLPMPREKWLEKNRTELLEACCNHDIKNVTRILDQSGPGRSPELLKEVVLARDDFRHSALHLASIHGEAEMVRLLLARGADVNAENNLGSTPLNLAAVAGSVQVVEILLDAGADVEHLDDISGTPLHGAARRNHFSCCRLLLNRGARVDAADGVGNRPLHLAAAEGAVSALETLVRHYADPQIRNMRGQTPLDVARSSWIGLHCKDKIARVLAGKV